MSEEEKEINRIKKKLNLRENDILMSVNCREMLIFTEILKGKIATCPLQAIDYVEQYERTIQREIEKNNPN